MDIMQERPIFPTRKAVVSYDDNFRSRDAEGNVPTILPSMVEARSVAPVDEERSEIESFIHALYYRYGFDFRDYSLDVLRRHILYRVELEGLGSISALKKEALRNPQCIEKLISDLLNGTTAMFRNPGFYLAFRRKIVPWLRTLGFARIWHVGCATGEEVYSMAILLREEGLYDMTRIYATDINRDFLKRAGGGIYPIDAMKAYTRNYILAGGTGVFSDYYVAAYDRVRFAPELLGNVVFARHDLTSDGPFHEFDVILCRNVLIYFNSSLQERAVDLFRQSLAPLGVLGMGDKETVRSGFYRKFFEEIDAEHKLFRKIG